MLKQNFLVSIVQFFKLFSDFWTQYHGLRIFNYAIKLRLFLLHVLRTLDHIIYRNFTAQHHILLLLLFIFLKIIVILFYNRGLTRLGFYGCIGHEIFLM